MVGQEDDLVEGEEDREGDEKKSSFVIPPPVLVSLEDSLSFDNNNAVVARDGSRLKLEDAKNLKLFCLSHVVSIEAMENKHPIPVVYGLELEEKNSASVLFKV